MDNSIDILVIGDYNAQYTSHVTTNQSLDSAESTLQFDVNIYWISSSELNNDESIRLSKFDGFLLVPGPYLVPEGVLSAIQYARESNIPFLSTDGGLSLFILEFAQNVFNLKDSLEMSIITENELITRRTNHPNELMELDVILQPEFSHSKSFFRRNFKAYGFTKVDINKDLLEFLIKNGFKIGAVDQHNDPVILEVSNLDFYVAAQYLPQLTSSEAIIDPLLSAFLKASLNRRKSVANNKSSKVS